jgi:hypothetical protein
MNVLIEIEKRYCREIVEFFCREIPLLLIPSSATNLDQLSSHIQSRLIGIFQERLFSTKIINQFRVDVNLLNKDERRDSVINNILDDSTIKEPNIKVIVRYNDYSFETLEQKIIF